MSKKQKTVCWLFLVAFALTAALARHSILPDASASSATVKSGPGKSKAPATAPQFQIARIEAELITITPRGFEPHEIRRSAGPFILAVDNRSGLQSVTQRLNLTAPQLSLGDQTRPGLIAPPLFEVTVPREQLDWSNLETLAPGRYALTEANHPSWVCYITITAS